MLFTNLHRARPVARRAVPATAAIAARVAAFVFAVLATLTIARCAAFVALGFLIAHCLTLSRYSSPRILKHFRAVSRHDFLPLVV